MLVAIAAWTSRSRRRFEPAAPCADRGALDAVDRARRAHARVRAGAARDLRVFPARRRSRSKGSTTGHAPPAVLQSGAIAHPDVAIFRRGDAEDDRARRRGRRRTHDPPRTAPAPPPRGDPASARWARRARSATPAPSTCSSAASSRPVAMPPRSRASARASASCSRSVLDASLLADARPLRLAVGERLHGLTRGKWGRMAGALTDDMLATAAGALR